MATQALQTTTHTFTMAITMTHRQHGHTGPPQQQPGPAGQQTTRPPPPQPQVHWYIPISIFLSFTLFRHIERHAPGLCQTTTHTRRPTTTTTTTTSTLTYHLHPATTSTSSSSDEDSSGNSDIELL